MHTSRGTGGHLTVTIRDVGPRDGLQNEDVLVPPTDRARLATQLSAAGIRCIEAVSFVRDDLVPQMAGAEEVVTHLDTEDGTTYAGLVLNERGYRRLATTALQQVHFAVGATEAFQGRNGGSSVEQALAQVARVGKAAQCDRRYFSVSISVAFGCPYEGEVDPGNVERIASTSAAAGAREIVLCDTIGVATPRTVRLLVDRCRQALGLPIGVHLHDTRNTAIAGVLAAIDAGATVVDSSVGGVGGCPNAPGAQGNVATEDVVYTLEREGIDTGVDLDAVIRVAVWLSKVLNRPLPGHLHRAGPFPAPR